MSSLISALEAASGASPVGRHQCPIPAILDSLEGDEREAVEVALAADSEVLSAQKLVAILRGEGFRLGNKSVANHRSGHCKCPGEADDDS